MEQFRSCLKSTHPVFVYSDEGRSLTENDVNFLLSQWNRKQFVPRWLKQFVTHCLMTGVDVEEVKCLFNEALK